MRTVIGVMASTALALAVLTVTPPADADGTADGPLLYETRIARLDGSTVSTLSPYASLQSRFSPDGATMAVPSAHCDVVCRTTISVVSPDGTARALDEVPVMVDEFAWSPDGTVIAAFGMDGTDFSDDIWRVPVDGSAATLVLDSTLSFRAWHSQGLSWHPTNGSVAFIASELTYSAENHRWEGLVVDDMQVYSVPMSGGPPVRVSAHVDDSTCYVSNSCVYYEYRNPIWRQDGSGVLVLASTSNPAIGAEPGMTYIGTLSPGQIAATVVKETRVSKGRMILSSDGKRLLYPQMFEDPDRELYIMRAKLLDLTTGLETTVPDGQYVDWQRCPGGVCTAWGTPPKATSRVTLATARRAARVIASGKLIPLRPTAVVRLVVEKQARPRSAWRRVTVGYAGMNDTAGTYRTSFRAPAAYRCRIKASYSGDARTRPAKTVVVGFRC